MPGIVAPPGYPEELGRFAKMLKVGIPEASVRGKMAAEGFDDDMYDKYLNPETAITLNQEAEEEEEPNGDDRKEEKQSEVDVLDPNQPNNAPPSNAPLSQSQSGYFSSQNFVPPPDSELKMDILAPVPVKKTLLIVNTFVVNTAAFLNKFVSTCEAKLHKINTDIQRMETTMLLLESKLSSIDWLRQAEQGQAPVLPAADDWDKVEFQDDENKENDPAQGGPPNAPPPGDVAPPPEPEKPAEDPLLSDPNMKQWFKMLKFGVPESAVRLKMGLSGHGDDIIDRVIQLGKK